MYPLQLTPEEFKVLQEKVLGNHVGPSSAEQSLATKVLEAEKNGSIKLQVDEHIDTSFLDDPDDIPMSDGGKYFYVACGETEFWEELAQLTGNEDATELDADRHHFTFNREAVDYEEAKNAVFEYFRGDYE